MTPLDSDTRARLTTALRAGVPRLLVLDDLAISPREFEETLSGDPDLSQEVQEAEQFARARVKAVLFGETIEAKDAATAAAWVRMDETDTLTATRPPRPAEGWHSGDPEYDGDLPQ